MLLGRAIHATLRRAEPDERYLGYRHTHNQLGRLSTPIDAEEMHGYGCYLRFIRLFWVIRAEQENHRREEGTMSSEGVSFVVACGNSPLTAQTFPTREEAERALDSLARVRGACRGDQMFVRQRTRRDRYAFKHMTGWAGFERQ
jgi:hypothetical protein